MMQATIKDIAKAARVSDTAVSLAFRENSRIGKKTREKVLKIAAQMGYVPNTAAQKLRHGKTKLIAFIINDITNPFYSLMCKEAEGVIENSGYEMISANSNWDSGREVEIARKMIQMRVEGVIFCLSEKNMNAVKLFRQYKIPCISIDSYSKDYDGSYVANDFEECGRLVSEHLYNTGCRRPGIAGSCEDRIEFSAFRRIFNSFEDNFRRHGVEVAQQNKFHAGLKITDGYEAFIKALANGFDGDGIICANDLCAMGVIQAAGEKGIIVGKDLAVVGIDDLDISAFPKIALSSVRQPYQRIARKAAEALFEIIEDKSKKIQIELQPELIVRNSSSGNKFKRILKW